MPVTGAYVVRRLYEPEYEVRLRQSTFGCSYHIFPELGLGLVYTGGIYEYCLSFLCREYGTYFCPGGLGLIGFDGYLLSYKPVNKC